MDFTPFDRRNYPTVSVEDGYTAWSDAYDDCVVDAMDLELLGRLQTIDWRAARRCADLACGTGRIGAWLRSRGFDGELEGVDCTQAMLDRAESRRIYQRTYRADIRRTPLAADAFDLVVQSLADEHLSELQLLYDEVARVLAPAGRFVIVGYHPQFLMTVGMPTHYHRPDDGAAVAITTHVHLLSDHVAAARAAGLELLEMDEAIIDDAYLTAKPKWTAYRDQPVSFVFVWRAGRH